MYLRSCLLITSLGGVFGRAKPSKRINNATDVQSKTPPSPGSTGIVLCHTLLSVYFRSLLIFSTSLFVHV